jgi:hypothetical protein
MKYAKDTEVPVERTRAEIETTVNRYGASGFMSGWQGSRAMVAFEMRDRRIKFLLPLPEKNAKQFTQTAHYGYARSGDAAQKAWEQACRQLWRALALAIKAKLEAVECGISEFDSEFMANIVLPTGMTLYETLQPDMEAICHTGRLPPLLPGPSN